MQKDEANMLKLLIASLEAGQTNKLDVQAHDTNILAQSMIGASNVHQL